MGTDATSIGGTERLDHPEARARAARSSRAAPPPEKGPARGDRAWIVVGGALGAVFLAIGLVVRLAPSPNPADVAVDRSSPDALVQTAFDLVEQERVEALPRLIHAESPAMRDALDQVGLALGEALRLSKTLRERFPEETAEMADRSMSGLFGMMRGGDRRAARAPRERTGDGRRGPRGRRPGRGGAGPMDGDVVSTLLADPLGWLEDAEGRVSTIPNGDDMAAVMVDGRPAFGLGLALRRDQGEWGVVVPTGMPMLSRFMPRNEDEWAILGGMAGSLAKGMRDARDEIEDGAGTDLESASRLVGEKAGPTLMMCFVAYQRALEARERDAAG